MPWRLALLALILSSSACVTPYTAYAPEPDLLPWEDLDDNGSVPEPRRTDIREALATDARTAPFTMTRAEHRPDDNGHRHRNEAVVNLTPNESPGAGAYALAIVVLFGDGWKVMAFERFVNDAHIDPSMTFAQGVAVLARASEQPEVTKQNLVPVWVGHGNDKGRVSRPDCKSPDEFAVEYERSSSRTTKADLHAVVCVPSEGPTRLRSWTPIWPD